MLIVFLALLIAVISMQIPYYLAMVSDSEALTLLQTLKIAITTLPFSFVTAAGYIYYFGNGVAHFSYPVLMLLSLIGSLVISLLVQLLMLEGKSVNTIEIAGVIICFLGSLMIIFNQEITSRL